MKKYLLILLVIAYGMAYAQAPNWQWAKSAGGISNDVCSGSCTDISGNVYITGSFDSPIITFGSYSLINNTTAGYRNIFLAKYDPSGNILWAKSAGGTFDDRSSGVCTDASRNVYLTGFFFSSTITFGSFTLTNSHAPGPSPGSNIYIVKYDSNGNIIWAKSAGGTLNDASAGIQADQPGNVVISGSFSSPSVVFGSTTLINSGSSDVFIAKYDAGGNVLWAKSAGGYGNEGGNTLSIDKNSNIFITGFYSSANITFGTYTLQNPSNPSNDIFLVKYNTSGNVLWAKGMGGVGKESITGATSVGPAVSVDVQNSANIFLAGFFFTPSITIGTNILTNAISGQPNLFIAKFDASGGVLWAKNDLGSTNNMHNVHVSSDNMGNLLLAADYYPPYVIFNTDTILNSGTADILLAAYNPLGIGLWAKSIGGSGHEYSSSISSDNFDNIFITGDFRSDSLRLGASLLTNNGYGNLFVAELSGITGINEAKSDEKFLIYPNPFSAQTTLRTDKFLKNVSLTVYNSFGQTLKQIDNLAGQTIIFRRDNLPSGLYFLRIAQDNKVIAADKLIITDN